jgi:amidophosphoribosyltransferase
MCGIVGICQKDNVAEDLFEALKKLQHRGHDSAGISVFKDRFYIYKKSGNVKDIFTEDILKNLKGNSGIAHVRYATQGYNNEEEAQPFFVSYPFGISMVHNGNITNRKEIQKKLENNFFSIKRTNDIELILFTFANELKRMNLNDISATNIFNALDNTVKTLKGAYSVITLIGNKGMLAFKDAYGIRPLVFGKKNKVDGVSYMFASETVALDTLGYEIIKELQPGEAVFIDKDNQVHYKILNSQKKEKFCIFEYIYFAKPESVIKGRLVAKERELYGRLISEKLKERNLSADMVTDIPETAYFSALSLAEKVNLPYKRVIIRNTNSQRSFIQYDKENRMKVLNEKFWIIKEFVKNKKIILVDDSIVRGSTAKHIIKLLREAGADKIYMVSASPMIKYPCVYGIDMSIGSELIAFEKNISEVKKILDADELFYLDLSDLKKLYENFDFCDACFSGNYPGEITLNDIKTIESERISVKN